MKTTSAIAVFEQGFVRSVISTRNIHADFGVTVEIFGRLQDNCWKEALRFDCLEREPHWHRFPAGGGCVEGPLLASSVAEAVACSVVQLREHLACWLVDLGYPESGREAAQPEFVRILDAIARAAEQLAKQAGAPAGSA